MKCLLLGLAIFTFQVGTSSSVCARPPDKVKFSPVPPLLQQSKSRTQAVPSKETRATRNNDRTFKIPVPRSSAARQTNIAPLSSTSPYRIGASDTSIGENTTDAEDAPKSEEIWESEEMKFARQTVLDFCRLSARTSVQEGEQFLSELSQLPPEEMLSWLERFQIRQLRFRREGEAREWSRQIVEEYSYRRAEERQQTALRIAEMREGVTFGETTQQTDVVTGYGYTSHDSLYYGPVYDPFIPIFDPSSPRGYVARAAAAASLPGDLPRDDPRNFLRGDLGFVTGDETFLLAPVSFGPAASPVLAPGPLATPATLDMLPVPIGPALFEIR